MTNAIPVGQWLDVIEQEYLSTFVKDGGGAVKFAVSTEEGRRSLRETLRQRSEALGYAFVELDAVTCRLHMPQDIFFGLASQVDWRLLARRVILRLLSENGLRVDGIDPNDNTNVVDAVARVLDLEADYIRDTKLDLDRALQNKVFKNVKMAKAFRVAMTWLCLKETEPGQYDGQALLDWLTGADTRIGNVSPFRIYTGINRTTARHFIESALYWLREAEYTGAVVLLDNTRVTLARNPKDGRRYYTKAMAMDHYELLREFIDGVDRLSGTMLVVATGDDFTDEQSTRGWKIYDALRTRVMNDVRAKNIVNPAAALVTLS